MCKSAIPNDHVIYAVDIGVCETNSKQQVKKSDTTFAWARLESAQKPIDLNDAGKKADRGRDINGLYSRINEDIKSQQFISIGFVAPMWFPVYDAVPIDEVFKARFCEEIQYEWYKQSGAAATLKAICIGMILFSQLRGVSKLLTSVTEKYPWKNKKEILIYEAFVAGKNYFKSKHDPTSKFPRINGDEWDAITAAYAFNKCHYGRVNLLHKAGSWNGKVFSIVQSIAQRSNLASDNIDCEVVGLA